jgi:glycosyltransferase involved in cell wall biosynthesis
MSFRFGAVISHPTQHHAPMFRELARTPGMRVKVFYCTDWGVQPVRDPGFGQTFAWDVPLLDGYEYEFLPRSGRPKGMGFFDINNPSVSARLAEFAPHALWVHGYGQRTCWRALRWAKRRAAVIYFGDSELLHRRPWPVRAVKHLVLRWFFRRCQAFITIGDNNETYYRHYGVPADRMFRGAYPVDVGRIRARLAEPGRPERAEVRQRYGIPADAFVVLFLAKMIPIKRPGDVVEAVALLRQTHPAVHALLVGDGELRPALEQRARELGAADAVHFPGFVNQRDLPLLLDAADILAMPSEKDPHPLAVTEALVAGNAVVASDRVGCVGPSDTVRPGVNGLVYPCGDVEALAAALRRLADDEPLRRRMGDASRLLADTQDLGVPVRAVLEAVEALRPEWREAWHEVPDSVFEQLRAHAAGLPSPTLTPILPLAM